MMQLTASCPPQFVIGEDADLKEWLIHLHEPKFCCRVVDEPFVPAEEESEEDLFVFEFAGSYFRGFYWFDPQPDEAKLTELLEAAADFVEANDLVDGEEDY